MRQQTHLHPLEQAETTGTILLPLSAADLPLVVAAIATVRREIDSEEFSTRLGVDKDSAEAVGTFLDAAAVAGGSGQPRSLALRSKDIVVALTEDDLALVNNALNEVLNGLALDEGALPPGSERDRARALLEVVHRLLNDARSRPDARREMGRPIHGR